MPNPQNSWHMLGYETIQKDGRKITIETVHKRENNNNTVSLQMHARIKLNTKPTITNGIIEFPSEEMRALNNALNYYSQLISVAEVEKVSISGPFVNQGFIPEDPQEKAYLDSSKGFESYITAHMVMKGNFFKEINNDQLLDRQDGVRIMSNVNSMNDSLSKFKELVRLFENAFGESSDRLANLLYNFLSTAPSAQYAKSEVDSWMTLNRHGATHADLKKTPFLIHDEDVQDDIDRILQAGYDVLFNKQNWHDASVTRRNLSIPASVINKTGMTVHRDVIKNSGYTINDSDRPFYAAEKEESKLTANVFSPPTEWWHKIIQHKN